MTGTVGWVILGSEGEEPLTSCASSGCLEGDGIHVLLTRWRSWHRGARACVKGSVAEGLGGSYLNVD